MYICKNIFIPVVPHKAVAEVSKIENYWRGELLWCMDGRANPLMDRKVVGVVLFGVVAVFISPTTAGYSRRKFRSQTSDNMDRWKAEVEQKNREEKRREEKKREDQRRERVRRKKMQMREKVGKSRNTVFLMICGSGGSKSRLAKAAGAEPAGQMRDEQLHVVVARSTFPSQNVQNTSASDHFWKLRCRKSARRCGAKHISKSKCTKDTRFGPLLEVEMSKKCTQLWREAHFEVKMLKTPGVRTTFGRSDVVPRGRRGTFEEDLHRCIFRGQAQYQRHDHETC